MKQQLVAMVLGEVAKSLRGEIFKPQAVKSAPLYSGTSVPAQIFIKERPALIEGREIIFQLKGYEPDILLVEARIEVENIFAKEIFSLEEKIYQCAHQLLRENGGNDFFSEDYSVFAVTQYQGEPEQFLQNAHLIAALLKSERLELDENEVRHTLQTNIKYAKNDLSIIDWDGAFLFDPTGDIGEDIELLTLANLQLLRHRILDRQLDERLEKMSELVCKPEGMKKFSGGKDIAQDLREIMKRRMDSISQLQKIERDIKLIGDWYSARFFELVCGKFRIDDWRKSIRGKLDSIEDVYSIVVENFTVSAKHRAEWIQIILFFILQVGWFALIVMEIYYFSRK